MRPLQLHALFLVLTCAACGATTSSSGKVEGGACAGEAAQSIVGQPGFETTYAECGTDPAQCLIQGMGLPSACASCYQSYSECVSAHCMTACNRMNPETDCKICTRDACDGFFSRCSGMSRPFPGSSD